MPSSSNVFRYGTILIGNPKVLSKVIYQTSDVQVDFVIFPCFVGCGESVGYSKWNWPCLFIFLLATTVESSSELLQGKQGTCRR